MAAENHLSQEAQKVVQITWAIGAGSRWTFTGPGFCRILGVSITFLFLGQNTQPEAGWLTVSREESIMAGKAWQKQTASFTSSHRQGGRREARQAGVVTLRGQPPSDTLPLAKF